MRRSNLLSIGIILIAIAIPAIAQGGASVGKPAPDFRLTSLAGDEIALGDLRGKIVVLHFGTGW